VEFSEFPSQLRSSGSNAGVYTKGAELRLEAAMEAELRLEAAAMARTRKRKKE
jgi:hypothetical protein